MEGESRQFWVPREVGILVHYTILVGKEKA